MDKFVVMISGANRGIGLAIAKVLSQDKSIYLSIGVRNTNSIDLCKHLLEADRVHVEHYDASKPETVTTWIENTLAIFGQIDGLVNNAAILFSCGIENYSETSLAWEYLKQSGKSRVINLVSIAGKMTCPDEFGYNLTKHALLAFTHRARSSKFWTA